ncbi:MAG: hypothetical protein IKF55_05480 [Oscillospiraceae bacterium]|nr:hypothetical protein [Oscillospiraceae bacterium]
MLKSAFQSAAARLGSAARQLGSTVGMVLSAAHSKKDMIDLRRQRWEAIQKGDQKMFTPSCMLDGMEIENVKEDFRDAQRIEQYRVSKTALYLPDGMRWKYIPLKAISQMEESFRVISAGHCVPVREKRPELDLITEAGTVHISLEKQASMQKLLEILRKSRES